MSKCMTSNTEQTVAVPSARAIIIIATDVTITTIDVKLLVSRAHGPPGLQSPPHPWPPAPTAPTAMPLPWTDQAPTHSPFVAALWWGEAITQPRSTVR